MKTKLLFISLFIVQGLMAQWNQFGGVLTFPPANEQVSFFGSEVKLSPDGNYLAVADPFRATSSQFAPNPIRIFVRDGDSWLLESTILNGPENEGFISGEEFGVSMQFNQDASILVVGIPFNVFNTSSESLGRVQVYQRQSNNEWEQLGADINNPANDFGVFFGNAVSIARDGQTIAVGSIEENGFAGSVYAYEIINGQWTQLGQTLFGDAFDDLYGDSLILSADGNTLAVGAAQVNGGPGYVRVYRNVNDQWQQIGIDIPGIYSFSQFGTSLAFNGDASRLVIGADFASQPSLDPPYTMVFENIDDQWVQLGNTLVSQFADGTTVSSTGFGASVAMSTDGEYIAVGAPEFLTDNQNIIFSGLVRLFAYENQTWNQVQEITGQFDSESFGEAVDFDDSGATLVIGGSGYRSPSDQFVGAAHTYQNTALLSVEDNTLANTLKAFPNPFNDQLTVSFGATIAKGNLQIFDALSREVVTISIENQDIIRISENLSAGMYFVRVTNDSDQITTLKVIKQ